MLGGRWAELSLDRSASALLAGLAMCLRVPLRPIRQRHLCVPASTSEGALWAHRTGGVRSPRSGAPGAAIEGHVAPTTAIPGPELTADDWEMSEPGPDRASAARVVRSIMREPLPGRACSPAMLQCRLKRSSGYGAASGLTPSRRTGTPARLDRAARSGTRHMSAPAEQNADSVAEFRRDFLGAPGEYELLVLELS